MLELRRLGLLTGGGAFFATLMSGCAPDKAVPPGSPSLPPPPVAVHREQQRLETLSCAAFFEVVRKALRQQWAFRHGKSRVSGSEVLNKYHAEHGKIRIVAEPGLFNDISEADRAALGGFIIRPRYDFPDQWVLEGEGGEKVGIVFPETIKPNLLPDSTLDGRLAYFYLVTGTLKLSKAQFRGAALSVESVEPRPEEDLALVPGLFKGIELPVLERPPTPRHFPDLGKFLHK